MAIHIFFLAVRAALICSRLRCWYWRKVSILYWAHKSLTRSDPAIYAYLRFGIRRQEAEERVFRREVEAASR